MLFSNDKICFLFLFNTNSNVCYSLQVFFTHGMFDAKQILSIQRKPNIPPEMKTVGFNVSETITCPVSLPVRKYSFYGIAKILPSGNSVSKKTIKLL